MADIHGHHLVGCQPFIARMNKVIGVRLQVFVDARGHSIAHFSKQIINRKEIAVSKQIGIVLPVQAVWRSQTGCKFFFPFCISKTHPNHIEFAVLRIFARPQRNN